MSERPEGLSPDERAWLQRRAARGADVLDSDPGPDTVARAILALEARTEAVENVVLPDADEVALGASPMNLADEVAELRSKFSALEEAAKPPICEHVWGSTMVPCPDGIPGCLVMHFGTVCVKCLAAAPESTGGTEQGSADEAGDSRADVSDGSGVGPVARLEGGGPVLDERELDRVARQLRCLSELSEDTLFKSNLSNDVLRIDADTPIPVVAGFAATAIKQLRDALRSSSAPQASQDGEVERLRRLEALRVDAYAVLSGKLLGVYVDLFPNYAWCGPEDAADLLKAEVLACRKERDDARSAQARVRELESEEYDAEEVQALWDEVWALRKKHVPCPGCVRGDVPVVLDEDGTLSSVSGEPGKPGHAVDDGYWWCEQFAPSEPAAPQPSTNDVPNEVGLVGGPAMGGDGERERTAGKLDEDREYLGKLYDPTSADRQYLCVVISHLSEAARLLRAPVQPEGGKGEPVAAPVEGMSAGDASTLVARFRAAVIAYVRAYAHEQDARLRDANEVEEKVLRAIMAAPQPLPTLTALEELCKRDAELGSFARTLNRTDAHNTDAHVPAEWLRALRDYLASVSAPVAVAQTETSESVVEKARCKSDPVGRLTEA